MNLFDVYPLYDVTPIRGLGSKVYDTRGDEYLDFYGGHAVISIGHSHPHYIKTISDQLKRLGFYSNSIHNPLQIELAEKLGKLSSLQDYSLFLCNSGAEANENALKVASFHTQRTGIVAFKNGFHGRTSAAVNITDNQKIQAPINHGIPTTLLDLGDIDSLRDELSSEDKAAVIVEGIQGIGGVYMPSTTFIREVAEVCQQSGTLLIMDEIQSGYGRSGQFFAFQEAGITPDLVTIAKGMGNGFPIGGVLISPTFEAKHGMLGTTFGGNHLACAAGIAVLDIIAKEDLLHNAAKIGSYLLSQLATLDKVVEVRGRGLMIGLELDFPIALLRNRLIFDHKLFTGSAKQPNTLRLLPPLCVTAEEADIALEKISKALKTI